MLSFVEHHFRYEIKLSKRPPFLPVSIEKEAGNWKLTWQFGISKPAPFTQASGGRSEGVSLPPGRRPCQVWVNLAHQTSFLWSPVPVLSCLEA